MMGKSHSTGAVIAYCAISALAALIIAAGAVYFIVGGSEGFAFISKMNAVRSVVEGEFIGETDWGAAADEAASGVIDSLGDRWSYYMTAEQYKDYENYSTNSTNGIGVTIELDENGAVRVVSVTEGSPAELAGVKEGQKIAFVAGESTEGMTLSELKAAIKAQTGKYELGLVNADGTAVTVEIANELVYMDPVSFKMLEDSVGYIRISNFEMGAAEHAINAIDELLADGARGIVFDVRSDPGGRLTELIDLLDYILPEGDIFISVDSDGGETIYTSDEGHIECPMAVLINAGTYSAAEFFAAALEEYGYAQTVGEASTGKARSQMTYVLDDGSAVHISTRSYMTPNRVNLAQQGGLVPDIEVNAEGENDAQLEAAIKSLS